MTDLHARLAADLAGRYDIEQEVGRGGMATVYLALDLKHGRKVALKVLKPELTAMLGTDRFVAEIRTTASLQHPHILPLFDSGEAAGSPYYVMPYVDGESLRDRLARQGRLPVEEAVRFTAQVAAALAYAHGRGVIHRDIKPENILLSHGQAIVADFGIARALEAAGGERLTGTGLIIGTPAYMSPEQASGTSAVDGRTDVYALGCVFYETLTGRPPFEGPTPLALLASHAAERAPRVRTSAPDVPARLEQAVERAMAKDPADRFQTATEFAEALAGDTDATTARPHRRVWRRPAAAAVALLAVATVLLLRSRPAAVAEPAFTQLTDFTDAAWAPALSPDGRTVAFLKGRGAFGNSVGPGQLFVMPLPDGEPVQLTSSELAKATPAFAPDGHRVAFTEVAGNFDAWRTSTVAVNGGPVTEWLPNASGLTWLDGQHVLFAEVGRGIHMGLRRATADRGEERDVYWPPSEQGMAHRAAASPDRRWVLVVEMDKGSWLPCRLVPFDGSSPGRLVGPADGECTYAAWSPDGRWMYFSADAGGGFHIWRQRFPDGEPEQLTHGQGPSEEEGVAVAPDGLSLITSAGVRGNSIRLLDGDGDRAVSAERYVFMAVASADGSRVFYLSRTFAMRDAYPVGSLAVTTLANGARDLVLPEHPMRHFDLSADDRLVAFVSGSDDASRRGIWVAPLDRSSAPRRVFAGKTDRAFFDPAGNIYFLAAVGAQRFLHRLSAPGHERPEQIAPDPIFSLFAMAPDGEWVVGLRARPERGGLEQVAVSTRGVPTRVLCSFCSWGGGPARFRALPISWTRDGRAMVVSAQYVTETGVRQNGASVLIPLRPGQALPDLPSGGISTMQDYLRAPGARTIPKPELIAGATPARLFFYEPTLIRNLYRVTLRN